MQQLHCGSSCILAYLHWPRSLAAKFCIIHYHSGELDLKVDFVGQGITAASMVFVLRLIMNGQSVGSNSFQAAQVVP